MGAILDKLEECNTGGKRYWLFKSEPDAYSIDDLKNEKDSTGSWDGIRNYQARNLMRDSIKKGDTVLFYHSNQKPPGIVGEATVVSAPYPDHTALDKKEKYYDKKATADNNPWVMVDVKFKKAFKEVISLDTLRSTPGLEEMLVTMKGIRLSIQPVSRAEYDIIKKMAG